MFIVINNEKYKIESPEILVRTFFLFDKSFGFYDYSGISIEHENWIEEMVKGAYKIGGRGPLPTQSTVETLNQHKERMKEIVLNLQGHRLDRLDEDQWNDIKPKIKELLKLVKGSGVGRSRATKMLHLVLRELVPILDNFSIKNNYIGKQGEPSLISQIRKDMIASRKLLDVIEKNLRGWRIPLSRVRIFDIFLWAKFREFYLKCNHIEPFFFKEVIKGI